VTRRSDPRGSCAAAAALAAAGLLLTASCASRSSRPHNFAAAGEEQTARAIAAWREAVARADRLGPSRLLYDARMRQGAVSLPGTLAVSTAEPVRATMTGPFGSPVATYADGALRGEKFAPVAIEPEPLLWLLGGVWKAQEPQVRGVAGDDALLVWTSPSPVEGVLHVPSARFTSLRVTTGGKTLEASYAGTADPWPTKVELKDPATKSSLRLSLVAREPLP
jgi:hypothetical protein